MYVNTCHTQGGWPSFGLCKFGINLVPKQTTEQAERLRKPGSVKLIVAVPDTGVLDALLGHTVVYTRKRP